MKDKENDNEQLSKKEALFLAHFFELIVLIIIIFSAIYIIKPVINELLSSLVLTIIFYPIYKYIRKKLKNKWIASFITILIIIIITIIPIYLVIHSMSYEIMNFFNGIKDLKFESFSNFSTPFGKIIDLEKITEKGESLILEWITKFIVSLPGMIFNYFLTLLITFFLLVDGPKVVNKILEIRLIKKRKGHLIINDIYNTVYGIVYGQLIVGLIQGAVGAIGLFIASKILRIEYASPIIWGLLMAISSLIPMIGTGLIWLPLSIIRIINGYLAHARNELIYGIFIFLWGAIVVANVDNFIRPLLISSKTKIHPILVLLGVIGGLASFGFIGLFIGPIILGVMVRTIEIYRKLMEVSK